MLSGYGRSFSVESVFLKYLPDNFVNKMTFSYHLFYSSKTPPAASLLTLSLPVDKKTTKVETTVLENPRDSSTPIASRLEYNIPGSAQDLVAEDLGLARVICYSLPLFQRLYTKPPVSYQNGSDCYRIEIEEWLDVASSLEKFLISLTSADSVFPEGLQKKLTQIDSSLRLQTYLVGHQLTLADIAVYTAVGKLIGFSLNTLENGALGLPTLVNMKRWWKFIHATFSGQHKTLKAISTAFPGIYYAPVAQKMENKTTALSRTAEKNGQEKNTGSFEGKLPGAVYGKVVTRFPPEPSGYLHIGHAKAALLNSYFARNYGGKLLVRFDDTNPANEKMEYETSIVEDLALLDIKPESISHTSDYFDLLQDYCEKLIKEGKFYVDNTPSDQMRQERGDGIESVCRAASVTDNLNHWEAMKQGTIDGIKWCVRAKIDMQAKNKCLRDPVMYRCVVDVPHNIHGYKYKVYPTYDFACPIVDSIEGVSHAMRTNEYADRIPQYQWVLKSCGLPDVIIYEFSRLNFVNTVLSKRKLQFFVDNGYVDSWADPRLPTVRGIRRRGLTVQALMDFILEQGPSKNVNLMEWDKLWAKNKQILDPIVPRYMAVADTSIIVILSNGPSVPEIKERPLHPKNPSVGNCDQTYTNRIRIDVEDANSIEDDEEITLMRWCNAIVEKIERHENNSVKSITMRLNPSGDFKKTKKKLHWVPETDSIHPVHVILRDYDYLIKKKKPEDTDRLEDLCNLNSSHDVNALADSGVTVLKEGDCLQFERRGYFRLDQLATDKHAAVFIKIPDGKQKPMSVIQTNAPTANVSSTSS